LGESNIWGKPVIFFW